MLHGQPRAAAGCRGQACAVASNCSSSHRPAGPGGIGFGQQQNKFFPAIARRQVAGGRRAVWRRRRTTSCSTRSPGRVAQGVVVLLKINIGHDQRQRCWPERWQRLHSLRQGVELAPVGDAGQAVERGGDLLQQAPLVPICRWHARTRAMGDERAWRCSPRRPDPGPVPRRRWSPERGDENHRIWRVASSRLKRGSRPCRPSRASSTSSRIRSGRGAGAPALCRPFLAWMILLALEQLGQQQAVCLSSSTMSGVK